MCCNGTITSSILYKIYFFWIDSGQFFKLEVNLFVSLVYTLAVVIVSSKSLASKQKIRLNA